MWNVCVRWVNLTRKCPCGWWIITSTLSWTVIQLAASFWRISVIPLESLSYFSLGSSSLSSSCWRKQSLNNIFQPLFLFPKIPQIITAVKRNMQYPPNLMLYIKIWFLWNKFYKIWQKSLFIQHYIFKGALFSFWPLGALWSNIFTRESLICIFFYASTQKGIKRCASQYQQTKRPFYNSFILYDRKQMQWCVN